MASTHDTTRAHALPVDRFKVIDGVEMVPGTVHLLDLERRMSVKHQNEGKSDIVLIPQPTNNPNDPLNWSRGRKEYHFWLLWIWGFIAAVSVNWGGPVWTQLTIDLNTSYEQLNISGALCFLFLGLGCVFLQPTAMKIGRRPVYLLGTLFNLAGCIWGGLMNTVQEYFGVNILTGFGAAPVDSLVEISTLDIFFVHERGTRLSLYIFAIYAGSFLGPVASGYIAASQSWRWCFWYLVIFFTILLGFQLLSLEESTFRRPVSQAVETASSTDDVSTDHNFHVTEKVGLEATSMQKPYPQDTVSGTGITNSTTLASHPIAPKSWAQRMALWDTSENDRRSWLAICVRPFTLVTYPAIVWAGIVYGVQIAWLSLLYSTQSLIFAAPPYNFSIAAVGNTNFAAFIGALFGMSWGGYLSDWCTQKLARRNKGIMEPEYRLWMMIAPAVINTAGILMYGVGAAQEVSWVCSAAFGTGFIAFGIGSGGAIALTYAVDCYPSIASESLVLMLFIRNIIGMAFTFAIQPWLDFDGLQNTSIIMAAICFVINMSFLAFTWKGKAIRRLTAKGYLSLAGKGGNHGGDA